MKLEQLHKEDNKLAIRITDTTAAYVNTLRRYLIARVPTMAIDYVEFKKNNTILYDEMVAHRLGLIPLTTDLESYSLPKEEWNEPTGDPRVELQLTLSVPPAKQATVVTAKELTSKDKKVVPVHKDMPIVKLMEGQDIEFIATARLGTGEEHSKWSPGHVWYKHYPHIKITKQPKQSEEVAKQYPDLFEVKSKKLSVKKGAEYLMPDKPLDVEGIEVTHKDGDYILFIESWGQLSPQDMIAHALSAYDQQLDEFTKLAKTL